MATSTSAPSVSTTVQFPHFSPPNPPTGELIHGLDPAEFALLRDHCMKAKSRAYCPHSRFRVGATLITSTHRYISGANFENASFPCGTCAERVALGTAVTNNLEGGATSDKAEAAGGASEKKKIKFKALGVSTDIEAEDGDDDGSGNGEGRGFCSPCGMCRQALREFCAADMPIFMFDKKGKHVVRSMGELLPMSFGPDDLHGVKGT